MAVFKGLTWYWVISLPGALHHLAKLIPADVLGVAYMCLCCLVTLKHISLMLCVAGRGEIVIMGNSIFIDIFILLCTRMLVT